MMKCPGWTGIGAGAAGLAGVFIVGLHFNEADPWFSMGRLLLVFGMILGAVSWISRRRNSIDEAFEHGYRIGFHQGQRLKPRLVHLPSERDLHAPQPR